MKNLKQRVKSNPKLKAFVHNLMMSKIGACPRWWIKLLVNPIYFYKYKGRGSKINGNVIMNISPINRFKLGERSVIEYFSIIDNGVGDVVIGDHSRVGLRNTIIGPVEIGRNTILAQNVVLSGLNHNYADIDIPIRKQGVSKNKITVGDDSWIGANSIITAGVSIGKHCVVAGGSVVTKDVPDYSVVGGIPAKVLKRYDFSLKKWI